MKVHVKYSDGSYYLEEYTEKHAAVGLAFVEIDDDDWREYLAWLDTGNGWHKWMRDLDNIQYAKEHAND